MIDLILVMKNGEKLNRARQRKRERKKKEKERCLILKREFKDSNKLLDIDFFI